MPPAKCSGAKGKLKPAILFGTLALLCLVMICLVMIWLDALAGCLELSGVPAFSEGTAVSIDIELA